jgi:Reverse transcriptase (RNA-dependent DNA polymerase)
MSNLSVVSKLLERLVANQLVSYLSINQLLPPNQSGFRTGHSTESAITKVLSDLLDAVDRGDSAVFGLLDLFAAFDTVDHAILLDRLRITFVVRDAALGWFRSYLSGRLQFVCCCRSTSGPADVVCDVPQGSVLGPILFIMYTVDLSDIVAAHGLSHRC